MKKHWPFLLQVTLGIYKTPRQKNITNSTRFFPSSWERRNKPLWHILRSFQDKRSVAELKSDTRYPEAEDYYFKMTSTERVRLLEDFDQEKNLAVPYLAYREAEIAFKESDKEKVSNFTSWIEKRYRSNAEIMELLKESWSENWK